MPHQPKAMPSTVLKALARLSDEQRTAVGAMVLRHVKACERMGFLPENLERAFLEAIELVVKGDVKEEEWAAYEPVRRYWQYGMPVDKGMG